MFVGSLVGYCMDFLVKYEINNNKKMKELFWVSNKGQEATTTAVPLCQHAFRVIYHTLIVFIIQIDISKKNLGPKKSGALDDHLTRLPLGLALPITTPSLTTTCAKQYYVFFFSFEMNPKTIILINREKSIKIRIKNFIAKINTIKWRVSWATFHKHVTNEQTQRLCWFNLRFYKEISKPSSTT